MSATRLKTVKPTKAGQEIKMQDASLDIWDKKYRLKDKQSQPVDADINATYLRVAKALSDVESKEKTYRKVVFYFLIIISIFGIIRVASNFYL